jgi:hypothetical protein
MMCIAVVVALQAGAWSDAPGVPRSDPFGFFAPSIVVSREERANLDRDRVVARSLSGQKGQLGVFVATRINAQPDALVAWTHAIVELKRSKYVLAIGRFSDPPRLSDLDDLALEDRDLDAIRRCRPSACGLKLSAAEIGALSAVAVRAGPLWRDAVQREFRRLLVERVIQYRAGGLAQSSPPADRSSVMHPQEALSAVLDASPYLRRIPDVMTWLTRYPYAESTIESFFYWSKEHYGEGKPVISVTHVGIVRPDPHHGLSGILVVGKQIFATHYIESALGLTVIVRDPTTGTSYLAYLNRSQVDFLGGWFGRLMRGTLEGRLKRQAPLIVGGLRARLESGRNSSQSLGESSYRGRTVLTESFADRTNDDQARDLLVIDLSRTRTRRRFWKPLPFG